MPRTTSTDTRGQGFGGSTKPQQPVNAEAPQDAIAQIKQGQEVSSGIHGLVLNNAIAKAEQIEAHVEGLENQLAHRIAAAVNPDLIEARTWGKVGNLLVEYGRQPVLTDFWGQSLAFPSVRSVATPSLQALYESRSTANQAQPNQQQLAASLDGNQSANKEG